jgi:hypothetical protein
LRERNYLLKDDREAVAAGGRGPKCVVDALRLILD